MHKDLYKASFIIGSRGLQPGVSAVKEIMHLHPVNIKWPIKIIYKTFK